MQAAGDAVKAGTVNQTGYLEVISTAVSKVRASAAPGDLRCSDGGAVTGCWDQRRGRRRTDQRVPQDSAVEGLVRLIEDSQAARSPTELVVERFAKLYTPCVVLVATGFATIPWVLHALDQDAVGAGTAEDWLYTSLVLLVTACPCALVISTPITYVCALVRPLPPPSRSAAASLYRTPHATACARSSPQPHTRGLCG